MQVVCLHESRANVGSRVDNTDNPGVETIIHTRHRTTISDARDGVRNTKVNGPRQIGTVGTSLIPTLYSSTNGAKDDGEVERAWLAPFVKDFVAKRIAFDFIQLGDLLESGRILCHQSPFLQEWDHVLHARLLGKLLDIVKESIARNASQRVLDSV